jgi:hypothetical protein
MPRKPDFDFDFEDDEEYLPEYDEDFEAELAEYMDDFPELDSLDELDYWDDDEDFYG